MNDISPLDGLTRSIHAEDLWRHHIGRRFVPYGKLRAFAVDEEGIHLWFAELGALVVAPEDIATTRLEYWLTEDEIKRQRPWAVAPIPKTSDTTPRKER